MMLKRNEVLVSPWTAEQVDALNRFQRAGVMHPFTCVGHVGGGDRTLVATRSGWICCHCDYTQGWAHAFMVLEPIDLLAALTEGEL
jgi:hypothetical protein